MWKIVRASVIGTAHCFSQMPCQDECYAAQENFALENDVLVCLVSDGAGSARESQIGSEIAILSAFKSIETTFNLSRFNQISSSTVQQWIENVKLSISEAAESKSLCSRDFACTLIGAIISDGGAIFFQVGDGAIVASSNGVKGIVFLPENGMYVNMTNFVTDANSLDNLYISITNSKISEIALFTDGIQRLALSLDKLIPHVLFFEPMLEILRQISEAECQILDIELQKFLNSPQVNERTDDDKTLVLATRITK